MREITTFLIKKITFPLIELAKFNITVILYNTDIWDSFSIKFGEISIDIPETIILVRVLISDVTRSPDIPG